MGSPKYKSINLPYCLDWQSQSIHKAIEMDGIEWVYTNALINNASKHELKVIRTAAAFMSADNLPTFFLLSNFTRFALPISQPDNNNAVYRKNGGFTVKISTGDAPSSNGNLAPVGIPYGSKARLILLYIFTEVYRSKSGEIYFGKSLSGFLQQLGFHVSGGENGTISLIQEQINRLARCRFEFLSPADWKKEHQLDDFGFFGTQLWQIAQKHKSLSSNETNNWPEKIHIFDNIVQSIRKHSIPLDGNAISLLKGNCLAMDWYWFLSYRARKPKKSTFRKIFVSWKNLHEQLGSNYKRYVDFRKNSIQALELVSAVFPSLHARVSREGIEIHFPAESVNKFIPWERSSPTKIIPASDIPSAQLGQLFNELHKKFDQPNKR